MHWEGVNEFMAVAEGGSYTAAGKRLGVSTAHVSRQVAALEARLSVALFYRTTRRVSLTDSGRQLYELTRPLLEELDQAQQIVRDQQQILNGRFRLTAPVNFGELLIVPTLLEFCRQYPNVDVQVELNNQRLDLIQQGIDLAIRIGELADSSMKARRLGARHLVICAAPAYLTQYGTPQFPEDLHGHHCLLGGGEHWRFSHQNQAMQMKVEGHFSCNSAVALIAAAKAGLGVAQLPRHYVLTELQAGNLQAVLQEYQPEPEPIWACYPAHRHVSATVRAFIDYLLQSNLFEE